jgi:type IV secretory pathway VirJ component
VMPSLFAVLTLAGLSSGGGSAPGRRTDDVPIVAIAAAGSGPLALVLTGDGDWAGFESTLADSLTRYGMPVLGVKMRAYLERRRSPDETAADIARVLKVWLDRWHRDRFVVIGYSRGANIAPFVLRRLPAALRTAVAGVALVGLEDHAGFQFHLTDLIEDRHRSTDLDVGPELDGLRGLRVICIYGSGEKHPYCPRSQDNPMRVFVHGGGHRVSGTADAVTTSIIIDQLVRPVAAGSGPSSQLAETRRSMQS